MALENNLTKLVIEGESQILITTLDKIMQGTKITKITRSWRLTNWLEKLVLLLPRLGTSIPSHVKRNDNQLDGILANVGIDNTMGKSIWMT